MRNQKPITLTESRLRQIIKEELSAARPQTHGLRARSLREGLDQQLNHAPGAAKPIRLTPKELERADRTIEGSPFTIVVRPQQDGRYWVVAVNVDTGLPLIPGGNLGQQYVDGKEGIPDAVRVVGRDLHKFTGYATPMTDKMRMGH